MHRASLVAVLPGLLLLLVASCADGDSTGGNDTTPTRPIEEVFADHHDEIMDIPGVVGTGIGECAGRPCIRVFVAQKTPAVTARIPDRLEGHPVEVEETGEFRPLPAP